MKISPLQKYILLTVYTSRSKKISRQIFTRFYEKSRRKPKEADVQNIITKSIERLINREFLVGYGRHTPHKWFIEAVRLTLKGKKLARKLLGEQQKLPFKIKNKGKNK